ncbi:mitochondrial carrier protein, S-adenosylmethionine transporter [Pseudohyphozyma bogoriensis]|nr:mitochondrial carrier protein, S-adenosylmethionine transporter [Pseudohyphozyma bogoriensis]
MSSNSTTTFTTSLISGGLAGTAVDTLFFPLDTLKTRAQSKEGFLKSGGFRGVYRGLGSAVVGSSPGAAAFFTTYESLKKGLPGVIPTLRDESWAPALHMLSASGGEVAACMIRVPTEVVKQRTQTAAGLGSWEVAQSVWRAGGVAGFYRGFASTVAREIPFTCLQFPLYERLKLVLAAHRTTTGNVRDLPAIEAAVCGSIAGGFAAAATTPLDVAKTRIMLSGRAAAAAEAVPSSSPTSPPPKISPPSIRLTISTIYREEGLAALWSGVVPRVIWISLGGAVFLGVYEAAKKTLNGRID